jgi:hypothetical protein
VLSVVVSILPLPCAAQMLYGSLVGNVTDESQGLLRGAEVVITNANTNLIRKAATNELGLYSFPNVPSGTYTLRDTDVDLQPDCVRARRQGAR